MSSELQNHRAVTPSDKSASQEMSTGKSHELSAQIFSDPQEFLQLLQADTRNNKSHTAAGSDRSGPHAIVIDGAEAGVHAAVGAPGDHSAVSAQTSSGDSGVVSDCSGSSGSSGISVDKFAYDRYVKNLGSLSQKEPPLLFNPIFGDSPTFR